MPGKRTIILMALLMAGCGTAEKPPSLTALESMSNRDDKALAREVAEEDWHEALRYLKLAREELRGNDGEEAGRFAQLGLLHGNLAITALRQTRARERLATATAELDAADKQLERLESSVRELEHEQERDRIRAHLVTVVEKNRRRAAAQEELREKGRSQDELSQLEDARLEVGGQMLGRSALSLRVIEILQTMGYVEEERLAPARGANEIAFERLGERDIAGVQEYVETSGVEVRRIWDDLWAHQTEGQAEKMIPSLKGVEVSLEGEGMYLAVSLGNTGKQAIKRARKISEALAGVKSVALLVVVSSPGFKNSVGARAKTSKKAAEIADTVVETTGRKDAVSHFGAGSTRPSLKLSAKRESAVLLLIPLPEKR